MGMILKFITAKGKMFNEFETLNLENNLKV